MQREVQASDTEPIMTARRHYRVVSPIFRSVPMVFSNVRSLLLDAGVTI